MDLFEEAVIFAAQAHAGMVRKYGSLPYLVHPMEAAAICATLTNDREVLAAAVLHDTVEDTDTTPEQLRARFGERVAALVASETEEPWPELSAENSWARRKAAFLRALQADPDIRVRILWLSDKLSNMRSFYRQWQAEGLSMWRHYHQKDPARQAWYYRSVAQALQALKDSAAWQEFNWYIETIFEVVESDDGSAV